ncbi:ssRNA exonuclease RAT1 SCDLUD_003169 [Saccharomycodes ludwigii]|uniref:ssRNA exonuclease RAT1 n=1 Tax=Saccharomycodes ludwigii TaxID=36035 RepID=UPI001E87837A|nr:hypothetical protein SCDLUD_003169 [Saccharomycodes ludwigii]KAH3900198.1 hypothetical protein SCDLUD_003169 [Saccharomycodes ludwigii]
MGVPSFFRWLSRKYPKIISPVIEQDSTTVDDGNVYSSENPNGELDNLYLDMNGIVHPCSHPENKPPPENEDEMLVAVFEYTNRVLNMARPRRILMIAVDGVAPRAKMNQQRARRFRSAKDAALEREKLEMDYIKEGKNLDDALLKKKSWDSNAITPGTPFMDKLAQGLRYWISFKLSTDPGWENLQVIISDATVPGEGEHKIMNFIRSQRQDPEYNPNTTHCIYGLDADLIFLGLATHEPHFKILREDVFEQTINRKHGSNNSRYDKRRELTEEEKKELQEKDKKKPFLWLHISVLREYLKEELFVPGLSIEFDLERSIDDWVFMCFFCGNDFLPHLPSLDVRESSIDLLVEIWKTVLPQTKGYMSLDGRLNLSGVELLLKGLGTREPGIFVEKRQQELRKLENEQRRKLLNLRRQEQNNLGSFADNGAVNHVRSETPISSAGSIHLTEEKEEEKKKEEEEEEEEQEEEEQEEEEQEEEEQEEEQQEEQQQEEQQQQEEEDSYDPTPSSNINDINKTNLTVASKFKEKLLLKRKRLVIEKESIATTTAGNSHKIIKLDKSQEVSLNTSSSGPTSGTYDSNLAVKLYEPGYHDRYYITKFGCPNNKEEIAALSKKVVKAYVEGISWVLLYYYQGCASWNWYYPYHYAPFASDFMNIAGLDIKFEKGEPFAPFEQLMSVLPASSGHTLPKIFRPLMSELTSPIIDFYPTEFPIDMNGKKMSWQGIALLPFIEEKRLLETVRKKYAELSKEDLARNSRKNDILLISHKNINYKKFVKTLYQTESSDNVRLKVTAFKNRISGEVSVVANDGDDVGRFDLKGELTCPVSGGYPNLNNSKYLKLTYKMLNIYDDKNKAVILNGYIPHKQVLNIQDKNNIRYGQGHSQGNNNKRNNGYYNFQRNFHFTMQNNFVETGPFGSTQYKPRFGGYKSFVSSELEKKSNQANFQNYYYNDNYDNYGNNNDTYYGRNYNNNYNSHGARNYGYNNYGSNNYNNGYNNSKGSNRGIRPNRQGTL